MKNETKLIARISSILYINSGGNIVSKGVRALAVIMIWDYLSMVDFEDFSSRLTGPSGIHPIKILSN